MQNLRAARVHRARPPILFVFFFYVGRLVTTAAVNAVFRLALPLPFLLFLLLRLKSED
jgi:hypothetical protein